MKKNSFGFVAAIITCALAGGVATSTGCGGSSMASLCEDICACQRCTSNDLAACQASGDKALERADAVGCARQFDDAVACFSAHVTCKESRAVFDGCNAEAGALTKCSSGLGIFGKDLCEQARDIIVAKFKSCGGTEMPPDGSGATAECTEAAGRVVTCQAPCIEAAPCSILVADENNPATIEQVQAVSDCLSKCK